MAIPFHPVAIHTDPEAARRVATDIARALHAHGHVAYFAGGCVRDALLGRDPTDYDIATDATPDRVQALFDRTAAVGAHFGVILVKRRGVTVEVATFRSEGPYSDQRRPDSVTFSDPESDARRRDFTINALFLDPLAGDKVIDFVGGRRDLDAGIVRAVGDADARLAEDHLRALRAVRFSARLGFRLDNATADAIRRHASELSGVSRERIGDEVRRMLAPPSRAEAARLVEELGLDIPVLSSHRDSVDRRLARLPARADLAQSLAAWLLDRREIEPAGAAEAAGAVAGRLRERLLLSNHEQEALRGSLTTLSALIAWSGLSIAARKRLAASDRFEAALGLRTEPGERPLAEQIAADVRILSQTPSGLAPAPLITGDDLIAAGWTPGPNFRRVLDAVYDAQLEDQVASRAQAMELAARLGVERA
jgi:poly(A) polymerase